MQWFGRHGSCGWAHCQRQLMWQSRGLGPRVCRGGMDSRGVDKVDEGGWGSNCAPSYTGAAASGVSWVRCRGAASRSTGAVEVSCSMAQEGGGGPSWTLDAGCVVGREGGCTSGALGSMGTIGWFTAGTVWCTSRCTGIALSWTHTPHTGDAAWCIGDVVTGCVGDAVHSRVVALAWRALSVGSMVGTSSWVCAPDAVSTVQCVSDAGRARASAPVWRVLGASGVSVAMSASCTAAAAGSVVQPWCIGALGTTCTVGRSVARMARRVGVGLSRACAPRAGDVACASFTSCAVAAAGAVVQLHCGTVLARVGAALSWSRAPGAGDMMGMSSMSCITGAVGVHAPRCGGIVCECVRAVSIVGCSVRWVRHVVLDVARVLGLGELFGHEGGGSREHGYCGRSGDIAFDVVMCHVVTRPCHVESRVGDGGSQAFCEGVEVAVSMLDGGKAIFASVALVEGGEVEMSLDQPVGDCEPMSEVVCLNPSSQCVGNTAYVTDDDRDFRGPERCCQSKLRLKPTRYTKAEEVRRKAKVEVEEAQRKVKAVEEAERQMKMRAKAEVEEKNAEILALQCEIERWQGITLMATQASSSVLN
ncbi:hypothetical protein BKA93DRAFT_746789 [Sparassis latifolia]